MSSWLGACMIAGCAIGATGIVIHHYSSSAYQIPPKITYMINEEEWVEGVVTEFNNKVEELAQRDDEQRDIYKFLAVKEKNSYGGDSVLENYKGKPELHRNECVSMMADAYRKEKDEEFKVKYKEFIYKCPVVERTTNLIV